MSTSKQFFDYAIQQRAFPFVQYAVSASDNVERRAGEIQLLIERARKLYDELETEATSPGVEASLLVPKTKTLHYVVLGTVEKLAVLAETLFTSLSVVKRNYKRLPFEVLKEIRAWPEVRWAKKAALRDLKCLLFFPKPSSIFTDPKRRKTARRASQLALREVSAAFGRVASFYERYAPIYNKYKHTISEHTGYTEVFESGGMKMLKTLIFFEDYIRPRRKRSGKKKRTRPSTWGIRCGRETLDYLWTIQKDLVALHKLLIVTRLEQLHNRGRPFFPSVGDFLDDKTLKQLSDAVSEERTFRSISSINLRAKLEWGERTRERMDRQAIRGNWVFKLTGHAFRGPKALSDAQFQHDE